MSLVIAFSGQGFQHPSMFQTLSSDPFGKNWLKQASEMMHMNLFDEKTIEKACADNIQVQLLIVILSVGVFYALKKQSTLRPAFLCGYSLGEIAAFCASSNLSLEEICTLVKARASYMEEAAMNASQSGLAVIKGNLNYQKAIELTTTYACHIAIINGEDHYIIGGLLDNIDALLKKAKILGVIKTERLPIHLPSHTPLLLQATHKFSSYLAKYAAGAMQYPILNALTQELIANAKDMTPILARELSETLHWDKVMKIAGEYGMSLLLELGPGNALKNMALTAWPQLRAYSNENFSTISGLAKFLKK